MAKKHSDKFEMVKKYYNTKMPNGERMWDEQRVRNAVVKGWITPEEYEEITGEKYNN